MTAAFQKKSRFSNTSFLVQADTIALPEPAGLVRAGQTAIVMSEKAKNFQPAGVRVKA